MTNSQLPVKLSDPLLSSWLGQKMEVDDVEIGADGGRCGDRTMWRLGHVDTVEAKSEGG